MYADVDKAYFWKIWKPVLALLPKRCCTSRIWIKYGIHGYLLCKHVYSRENNIKFTIFRLSQNVDIDGVVYALLIA